MQLGIRPGAWSLKELSRMSCSFGVPPTLLILSSHVDGTQTASGISGGSCAGLAYLLAYLL